MKRMNRHGGHGTRLRPNSDINCRVQQKLTNSDHVMCDYFIIEVHLGINDERIRYRMGVFRQFVRRTD